MSLGDVGDILSEMEQKCSENSIHPPVSDHILVLMVRVIFLRLSFLMYILVQRVSQLTFFSQLCGEVSVNLRAQASKLSA